MNIGWPEGIYLALALMGIGISLAKDGQPETGTFSFFRSLGINILVGGLLWWGGFFA